MSILDRFKTNAVISRKSEEMLYSIVAEEMGAGVRQEGLWLKALQLAEGSKKKRISEYIKLRVQSLKDDMKIVNGMVEPDSLAVTRPGVEELISLIEEGRSLAEIASRLSSINNESVKRLINTPDACEEYPLHIAIKINRLDIAEWLLTAGASLLAKNSWDKTPMDIAVDKDNSLAISLLEKYSALRGQSLIDEMKKEKAPLPKIDTPIAKVVIESFDLSKIKSAIMRDDDGYIKSISGYDKEFEKHFIELSELADVFDANKSKTVLKNNYGG